MQTKDESLMKLIDTIGEHYRKNIGNRYVRNSFSVLPLAQKEWDLIESVTEKAEYFHHQGYHIDELYDRVLALGKFIYHARRELKPHLPARLATSVGGAPPRGNERILRDLAVNNFGSNLSILGDMVNQLYTQIAGIDRKLAGSRKPVLDSYPQLSELGSYLVPDA
ncbi:MAG: hypothetical protein ACLFP4_09545 [Spirochaetales bacterium]